MREKLQPNIEKRRYQAPGYPRTDHTWGPTGFFMIPYKYGEQTGHGFVCTRTVALRCMSTAGNEEHPWEHVSITVANEARCPSWEEMCAIKDAFWKDDECVIQFHPPDADHVNFHPFCLHLWRPWGGVFPQPPAVLVGPKTSEIPEEDPRLMARLRERAKLNEEAGKVIEAYVQTRNQAPDIDYLLQSTTNPTRPRVEPMRPLPNRGVGDQ